MSTTTTAPMERKTLTKAGQLSLGDRFYKQSDKNKLMHTVTRKGELKCKCNKTWAKPDGYRQEIEFKNETVVIFLRNINQQ
jgi:hypothetical protein